MSARLQVIVIGMHLLIAVTVLVSVTVLTALQRPITPLVAGIFGTLIGLAGGSATAAATLGTALNGKTAVPPEILSNQQQIIREQGAYLATGAPLSEAALAKAAELTGKPLPGGEH